MKVLTIGSAIYDLFLEHETPETITLDIDGSEVNYILLEEGHKIELKSLIASPGGGALNAASTFKKLGFSAAPCCKIGDDSYGQHILQHLRNKKISSTHIHTSSTEQTGCSYIIPAPSGNQTILVFRGANLTLNKSNLPLAALSNFDQIYIASLSKQASALLPIICTQAKKYNIPIAANPGTSQLTANVKTLEDSLYAIEILIVNCFEATLLMEQFGYKTKKQKLIEPDKRLPDLLSAPINRGDIKFTLQEYFKELHARGPRIVVVTNGSDGVYVSDGSIIYYHPSLPITITSTVGAGDAFSSTFVAQLLKKKSLENAIRAAIINSAAVLEHLDATTGLLNQEEIDELVAEIDQKGIKKFSL